MLNEEVPIINLAGYRLELERKKNKRDRGKATNGVR